MLPALPTLTLIVAATHTMGIGRHGALPWPALKQEMAYFARVTKRPPPPPPSISSSHEADPTPEPLVNAVIMGRKTWESIPAKYRPLKGRVNVVVTRAPETMGFPSFTCGQSTDGKEAKDGKRGEEPAIAVQSIPEGLETLQSRYPPHPSRSPFFVTDPSRLGRVFVIGGAEIYALALLMPECERILLTRVRGEYECDTFFPVTLDKGGDGDESGRGWVERRKEELDKWAGEEVPVGLRREGDVEYEFGMWERERGGGRGVDGAGQREEHVQI